MEQNRTAKIANILLLYVIWLVLSVLIIWLALFIHETVVSAVFLIRFESPWAVRAIDLWSMVLIGLLALVAIFVLEGYLRDGVRIQKLWRRVATSVLVGGVVAAITAIVRVLV